MDGMHQCETEIPLIVRAGDGTQDDVGKQVKVPKRDLESGDFDIRRGVSRQHDFVAVETLAENGDGRRYGRSDLGQDVQRLLAG